MPTIGCSNQAASCTGCPNTYSSKIVANTEMHRRKGPTGGAQMEAVCVHTRTYVRTEDAVFPSVLCWNPAHPVLQAHTQQKHNKGSKGRKESFKEKPPPGIREGTLRSGCERAGHTATATDPTCEAAWHSNTPPPHNIRYRLGQCVVSAAVRINLGSNVPPQTHHQVPPLSHPSGAILQREA